MSGALLVGDLSDAGFAALRTRHFAAALVGGGELRVVDWRDDVAGAARAAGPAAVVTAGNHGPTRAALAALAALDATGAGPAFWLDVAGDPFAEAQAFAAFSNEPAATAIEATAVWAAAYARADAFSTVCAPGRYAALGALGLLGRLPSFTPGEEPVYVMPCAAEFPDAPSPARGPGQHVALIGGFNTWFDDETLLAGLLLAMSRGPVEVTVAGGAIDGHHTEGFERFRAGALASSFAARFRFVGWVPHVELRDLLAPAHLTICLDRAGPEAELGARTRVLYALHQGLRVLATTRSPIVAEAAAASMVEAVPAACEVGALAAAEALAGAILRDRGAPAEAARRTWLNERSIAATSAPLRAWAADPQRSALAPHADVLAALQAERDALRTELTALRASPTFKVLNAGVRLLPLRFRR
ncbi:hypothetical protein LBMAG42_52930 [Deltaproteobacteria bacterium]|nr:hypothetical protein LBMAG42_52930 [Deltaproteobacteria bacterium]